MKYTIDNATFLKIMQRMLGVEQFERINRRFYTKHGFSPDEETMLRARANLCTKAMLACGLLPCRTIAGSDTFTFDFGDEDEKAVLFRMRCL